jgi:tetratricopeptide (TPR) repeat protein
MTKKDISIASLTPSFAKDISNKLDVRTLILGNILKAGNMIRINAQIMDADTEEIYKTYQVNCASENDLFTMADSLSGMIKNFIEIKKISDEYNVYQVQGNSLTNSSEAFKNYIRGMDAFKYIELASAADWFTKAIEEDSTFIDAYIYTAYANLLNGRDRQAKYWANKVIEQRVDLTVEKQLRVDQLNAYFFETPHDEIKYLKQLIEIDELNPFYWHQLGFAYYKIFEFEEAVKSWEQVFKIHEKWGTQYQNPYIYFLMGNAYHKLNEHEKEEMILALGNQVFPNAIMIQQHQAICAFSRGDHAKAEEIMVEYKSIRQNILHCTEAMISSGVGAIYTESGMMEMADASYQEAIAKDPENLYWISEYAWFLVDNDINIEKGLKLADQILEQFPEHWPTLDTKGWGLYKQGKLEAALTLLKDSWDLKPAYSHSGYLHIQKIEQAVANQTGEL